jgi:zinc D-Ala-D-Ala dipeptidase
MKRVAFALLLACDATPVESERVAPAPSVSASKREPPPKPEPPPRKPEPAPQQRTPPAGWIDLRVAIPDAVFAVGYATKDNFTGVALPGYGAPGAWLRDDAAAALRLASDALAKDGFRLVVFDAYRPRRASVAMVRWAESTKRTDLLRDGFISARSQHNRGVAVDVGLADASGKLLDMGTPWDHFGPEAHVDAVKGEAGDRRKALAKAMRSAGFRPLAIEWWHFIHGKDNAQGELDVPYGVHEPD